MIWDTNTVWFEFFIVTLFFLLGHIFLGHFEERTSKTRKLFKYIITVSLVVFISAFWGRMISLTILGLTLLPILYIHCIHLPKNGINGWTGEPKSKYYDLRGWDKNIFINDGEDNQC